MVFCRKKTVFLKTEKEEHSFYPGMKLYIQYEMPNGRKIHTPNGHKIYQKF
jgi:hypothetical protein